MYVNTHTYIYGCPYFLKCKCTDNPYGLIIFNSDSIKFHDLKACPYGKKKKKRTSTIGKKYPH